MRVRRVQDPSHREFLPSALQVIDVPPSPDRLKLVGALLALLAAVVGLGYFGHIPVYTSAPGKIQVVGRTKVVEPAEAGQVTAIHVKDGDRVEQGSVLVDLDPTNALASRTIIADKIATLRAQMIRLRVETKAARASPVDAGASIVWETGIPADVRGREEAVLRADLSELSTTLADLTAQRKAAEISRDNFTRNIASQNELIGVTSEHVKMNDTLASAGWNSRLQVVEILKKLRQQQVALSGLQGGLAGAEASIPLIDSEIAKARDLFVASDTRLLASSDRQLDDLRQQLTKADQSLANMTLRSPLTGTVQGNAVSTIGQVVKPGQQLMQVVPEGVPLEVIAYVSNTDIGFLKVGQKVGIKLDTFPYATYGILPGTITKVASDALPADTKKNVLQTAALDGDVSQSTAAQKTGNIVFPITVETSRTTMDVNGTRIALSAGMAATVDIETESRRVLDYLWSPLVELFTTAAHEQ